MIMDSIRERALELSPLCVGLDLRAGHVPQELREGSIGTQLTRYAQEIVNETKEYAACYKVQIACYEEYGLEGLTAYRDILRIVKDAGHVAIADIKRGDIGSTAEHYAKGHFTGDFASDVVTLNPYMGYDAIEAFAKYADAQKGAFILGKTSNPSSVDFQDLKLGDAPLYERVLGKIREWNTPLCAEAGSFGALGAVVGVNAASDLEALSQMCRGIFLLIPGYGAQGARLEDIRTLLKEQQNGVVNVSRGLSANVEGDYRAVLRSRAAAFAKELRSCYK